MQCEKAMNEYTKREIQLLGEMIEQKTSALQLAMEEGCSMDLVADHSEHIRFLEMRRDTLINMLKRSR